MPLTPIDSTTWGATLSAIHKVEVGDKGGPHFLPKVKFFAWDEESWISLRFSAGETGTVEENGGIVSWHGTQRHMQFQDNSGGFSFKTILDSSPANGFLTFILVTHDVDLYYQPSVTDLIGQDGIVTATETKGFDAQENLIVTRPLNVVGSYAVYKHTYKQTKKNGTQYMTNKVGHIYRPKAIDSLSAEEWCTLELNGANLKVHLPTAFMASATYPVTIE